jgi:hypothetical protein
MLRSSSVVWLLALGVAAVPSSHAQPAAKVLRYGQSALPEQEGAVLHEDFLSPEVVKAVGLTAAERAAVLKNIHAIAEVVAAQPLLQPPRGYNVRFFGHLSSDPGPPGPRPRALRYGVGFGAFGFFDNWEQLSDGRTVHHPQVNAEAPLMDFRVNDRPGQFLAPRGAPLYEPEWQVFSKFDSRPDLGGFPLLSGLTLLVSHLSPDELVRPVSVERMLRLYQPRLQALRDARLKAITAAADAMKRQQTPAEVARQRERFDAAMARLQADRSMAEVKKQAEIGRLQAQWDKDGQDRALVMQGDPEGPLGASWRVARDAAAQLEQRLASMSAAERGAPACGTRKPSETALEFTAVLTVGAPSCWPIVEANPEAFRADLPRSAIRTLMLDVGPCRDMAGDPDHPKVPGVDRCVANVRAMRGTDWKRMEALLDH